MAKVIEEYKTQECTKIINYMIKNSLYWNKISDWQLGAISNSLAGTTGFLHVANVGDDMISKLGASIREHIIQNNLHKDLNYMRCVKVTFANEDTITTSINGTEASIKDYYAIGRWFNIGTVEDNMQQVTKLEFIS